MPRWIVADLPTSWDEEPWPLEEPDLPAVFRPRNWSDSHDDAPQVADLADEAQVLVDRYGMSMERALVSCQHRRVPSRFAGAGSSVGSIAAAGAAGVAAGSVLRQTIVAAMEEEQLERARQAAAAFEEGMRQVAAALGTTMDYCVSALRSLAEAFEAAEDAEERRPQPMCPTHGVLAKGGFCRRCSARQARRSSR